MPSWSAAHPTGLPTRGTTNSALEAYSPLRRARAKRVANWWATRASSGPHRLTGRRRGGWRGWAEGWSRCGVPCVAGARLEAAGSGGGPGRATLMPTTRPDALQPALLRRWHHFIASLLVAAFHPDPIAALAADGRGDVGVGAAAMLTCCPVGVAE